MKVTDNYEMVIGLEVHVELKTATKIFCGCSTRFGAEPNTQCCPVCTGMPGTLPVLNKKVVEYAVKAGIATNCEIAAFSKQDRKNYFYPDLPKAYQISQYDLPLCEHGYLDIETSKGQKRIGITRIHIEEDAGKLVHEEGKGTFIDCNRCGVPLIEIVSEPDIRSAEEARAYVEKLRSIVLYTGISDGKMNEGSLRCDVNLSVRKKGDEEFGTRTEMKNLNSFQSIEKAIEYEFNRQVIAVEAGEKIIQETRRFNQNTGKTSSMRRKEDANDYRYFPDPDLAPIEIPAEIRQKWQSEIPVLPDERKALYVKEYGLTPYAAEQITMTREIADYFEHTAKKTKYPKLAANIILSDILKILTEEETKIPVCTEHLATICNMQGDGNINSSTAKKVLVALWENDTDPVTYVKENNLEQLSDEKVLTDLAKEVIAEQPKMVESYKNGKVTVMQALIGQTMKKTQGRGNPAKLKEIMENLLK